MKQLASLILALSAAAAVVAPARASLRVEAPGEMQRFSAEVQDTANGPAVAVGGKQYFLSGAIVYDPAGKRTSARLKPGTLVSFQLQPAGAEMRIREVWTVK